MDIDRIETVDSCAFCNEPSTQLRTIIKDGIFSFKFRIVFLCDRHSFIIKEQHFLESQEEDKQSFLRNTRLKTK